MLPRVNQILILQVASSDEEEAKIEYKSRIADIQEGRLLIEIPLDEKTGRLKKLYLGDELSAFFLNEEGVKHYFTSHVLGFRQDVLRLVEIRLPELDSITKIQRRSFLRVSAELEMAVRLNGDKRFIVQTDDVGGGGISFLTEGSFELKSGDTLECWLLLTYKNGSVEHANFKAEIVRVRTLESGRKQVMVKYISISDAERQKIIRFCFERQLEVRKQ
ncbi:flagellar brake protein [Paenibacillus tarimensis]|uniref:flagellar brake protein n=1 Tax=Paenibacillus tarimensis TaxID=416012 RepID=UPI001F468467|nr:flagellar brake domain-containing protein [Paenibacillus tarimensis]MCF2942518.1 flagellar brake domain-containing protein [Paenibacillus tarimensis]